MKQPKKMLADIDFLYEIGNIRLIDRSWRRFHTLNFANLAEHHFRVCWLALIIAAYEGKVDTGKIIKMALIHDIAESRATDVDYLSRQYVERNEELAIKDMLKDTALEKEFYSLWEEYESRESLEAKIVKDADNLDVDFELAEQENQGSTLKGEWTEMRGFVAKEKLFTDTAKKIFDQLSETKPHNWHLKGRNRRSGGDWKK
jgi:putative hydrolase of HD superfamily